MDVRERFMAKVQRSDGCWLWQGYVQPNGYGMFRYEGRPELAHRVSYVLFVSPIPEGLTVDHVRDRGCLNRHCVRPDHLEAVTLMENRMRGRRTNQYAGRDRCANGHPFNEVNTFTRSDGHRGCRACRSDIDRRRRTRNVN